MDLSNSIEHYAKIIYSTEGIESKFHVIHSIIKTAESRLTDKKSGFCTTKPIFIKNEGIFFYCPPNDSAIGAIVEIPNVITRVITNELSKTNRRIYIDIGANIGDTAFPISLRFPKKRVIAVEPIQSLVDAMKQTKKRNKIENIDIVCAAISKKAKVEILIPRFGVSYISGLASDGANPKVKDLPKKNLSYDHINVNTMSLDLLIKNNRIDPNDIALIKIDVEGAEVDVLRSGKKTILTGYPPILFEANSFDALLKVIRILDKFGYDKYEKISDLDYIAKKSS